jgi:predicted kinase
MREDVGMADEPQIRSVKISEDERRGWSSERPRREGEPTRAPDISVRCRVLRPTDHLRYSPGSMLVIVSPVAAERDEFADQLIQSSGSVLSLDKVRALLAGRASDEEIAARAPEILQAAIQKRLEAGETVVVTANGMHADERERYARLAAAFRRPRHLLLLEPGRADVEDSDRAALNELRRRLDAGELGAEGYQTATRIGGAARGELKRIVFAPPPRED